MRIHIAIFRRLALLSLPLLIAAGNVRAGDVFAQTNLISDNSNVVKAQAYDPNLIDPWGIAFSTGSPMWVADQGSGVATIYNLKSTPPSVLGTGVPVQNLGNAPPSGSDGPTGQVSTGAAGITVGSTDFQVSGGKASFIFDNLDGSISAWRGGLSQAVIETSVAGASFTGLAIGNTSTGAAQIYAADQNSPNVYVFNSSWAKIGALVGPQWPPVRLHRVQRPEHRGYPLRHIRESQ